MTFSQKSFKREVVFLVDNGSLRPAVTLGLRRVAWRLSRETGAEVLPVSVLHSDKLPATELEGAPAMVFRGAIKRLLAEGVRHFRVLPFFFGPSRALTDFLPEVFEREAASCPDARLKIAPPLGGDPAAPDPRLAEALADRMRQVREAEGLDDTPVVLVDHGSPVRAVAELRDRVGEQLGALLPGCRVTVSSMERRPEPEYDFNEPLLEHLLGSPGFDAGSLVVVPMFLLEGRHAGPDGDIAQMCQNAEAKCPGLTIHQCALLGEHPLILAILKDRLKQGSGPAA